ncbi:hypothetical protein M8J76_012111 [Diaphorina citri]|nr:hypothetical protein M8J76_012111 [Diaphorina citri]
MNEQNVSWMNEQNVSWMNEQNVGWMNEQNVIWMNEQNVSWMNEQNFLSDLDMVRAFDSISVLLFWTFCPLIIGWPTPLLNFWSNGVKSALSSLVSGNNSIQAEESPRVLNFFPVPIRLECGADDGRRRGLCLNTYDCRIQHGTSYGKCAYGFGVCCVWHLTCGQETSNNITYFTNPGFPSPTSDVGECAIQVKKIAPEISQIRLDFLHFTLGQPNRLTGDCDSDVFIVGSGLVRDMRLCGSNSGHHMYFDVDDVNEPIVIYMKLSERNMFRLWEIKITQIEFNQRAPAGCTQYFTEPSGIIQTWNFAVNGRHLANQDYVICMRQNEQMCSIAYEPCDENSFKIGPPGNMILSDDVEGSGDTVLVQMDETRDCNDRIMMPCDFEEFIMPEGGPGVCDLLHCGTSFCTGLDGDTPCRIESSTTPFQIRVQFGAGTHLESPEDNLGMCLRYEQQVCAV